jgi:hypothetical protein
MELYSYNSKRAVLSMMIKKVHSAERASANADNDANARALELKARGRGYSGLVQTQINLFNST